MSGLQAQRPAEVHGRVAPGFERIADSFELALAESGGLGAALSIHVDGLQVVDVWGGISDSRIGRPWKRDTAPVVFSCTKGLVSILAAQLVEAGQLDYQRPVADYWPEFSQNGKAAITIADILSHRAGLSAPDEAFAEADVLSWEAATSRLAAQKPLWSPAEGYAYHALTHGWLVGEVLRRITQLPVGMLFFSRIAGPLGAEAWIGLPPEQRSRVAFSELAPDLVRYWQDEAGTDSAASPNWPYRAMTLGGGVPDGLVSGDSGFNDWRFHRSEIPGAGGIATARALSRIWSATVSVTGGVRLLTPAIIAEATVPQSGGKPVFEVPGPYPSWGMGFQLDSEARRYLGPRSFGHDGAGGQCAFADPDTGVGFAFVTNWLTGSGDMRATRIVEELRRITG